MAHKIAIRRKLEILLALSLSRICSRLTIAYSRELYKCISHSAPEAYKMDFTTQMERRMGLIHQIREIKSVSF